jgi:hypothetical protein
VTKIEAVDPPGRSSLPVQRPTNAKDPGRRNRPARARAVLAGLLGLVLASSVVEVRRPVAAPKAPVVTGDVDLFAAVVARLRAGERYYDAMGMELRHRHYPTASVFNWRTPFLYEAMASVPAPVARGTLACFALLLLVVTAVVLANRSVPALMAAGFVQIGAAVAVLVAAAPLLTEAWAGVLLGLSVGAYRLGARRTGAGVGLLALFVRELVGPYALVCGLIALRNRQWDEVKLWSAGFLGYCMYYIAHVHEIMAHGKAGDLAHASSWIYGGGPAFLLQTLKTNAFLLASPPWIPVASILLAVLVAACGWNRTPTHVRATVVMYVVTLMVVGQPFNTYWGLLTAPVWGFATADGVDALGQWLADSRSS